MEQVFVAFDGAGTIVAFYLAETSPPPPDAQTVEISHAQWLSVREAPHEWRVQAGSVVRRPAPPAAEVMPPRQVSMRQARLALLASGHLAQVDGFIAALPTEQREAVRIEWEYAATVERDSPLVALLGQSLSLDADALDALFIDAAAR